ncbi:MAG TPA: hypothetical protein VHP58_05320, partial [Alphaproteobacteria bacterium]|nr:hypothetical protein [Alphaproteobacteria bacterium]
MSKTANKMVKADGQALVESALGEVPLVGTLVSMVNHWRLGRQVDQIERFMQVAEVDKTYLDGLAADDAERELFMEYVSLASNTTSPLVCITLAFIFKDPALGPSIKSLYARSLSGIS